MGHYPEDTEEEIRQDREREKAIAQRREKVVEASRKVFDLRGELATAERVVVNLKRAVKKEEKKLDKLLQGG